MLKGSKEEQYWKDFTPDMMSEEERVGDKYVRHPPSYRSEKAKKFIEKLDGRLRSRTSERARFNRTLGSPRKLVPPHKAKKWTICVQSTITGEKVSTVETSGTSTNPNDNNYGDSECAEPELDNQSESEFSVSEKESEDESDTY